MHMIRFYKILKKFKEKGYPVKIYMLNTVGKIGARYECVDERLGEKTFKMPLTKLELNSNGIPKPIGGISPTIEETELFLLQAVRDAVEYDLHPIWGKKVLVPEKVEGLSRLLYSLQKINALIYF